MHMQHGLTRALFFKFSKSVLQIDLDLALAHPFIVFDDCPVGCTTQMASPFPIGTRVVLRDLKARPEYNGRAGVVVQSLNAATGRYVVELLDGEECSLRPDNLSEDAAPTLHVGSRVVLHGLVAQAHYNSKVGIVSKTLQIDSERCCVTLCDGGEEVTVRIQNLKHASDATCSAVATSSDAALEILLKAVAFLSKFEHQEQVDLIAKMKIKDKFHFMREGSPRHAYFLDCLSEASQRQEPKEQVALEPADTRSQSSHSEDATHSIHELPHTPTFSFRWSKGESHCVENEVFDPSEIDAHSDDDTIDAAFLQRNMFGADPPKIFPVRSAKLNLLLFFHLVTLCQGRFVNRAWEVGAVLQGHRSSFNAKNGI